MNTQGALPQQVFLSHASEDAAFAVQIFQLLRDSGIPVWFSRTKILGAQQWHDEIGKALEQSD